MSDEEILDAARAALVDAGPAVSLQVVADRLGVTAAALLKRMGSREAMVVRALRLDAPPVFLEHLSQPPDLGPLRPQVRAHLLGALSFFRSIVPLLVVARAGRFDLTAVRTEAEPAPVRVRRVLAGFFEQAHALGLAAPAHPAGAAELLVGAIEAACFHDYLEDRSLFDDETLVDRLLDGVWPAAPDERQSRTIVTR